MVAKKKPVVNESTTKTIVAQSPVGIIPEPEVIAISYPVVQELVAEPAALPAADNVIYKYLNRLVILALVLGWSVDFLFWDRAVGANFAVFMSLCLLGGITWLVASGLAPARNALWLLAPFVFFVVVTFLRQEPLTIFLAFTFTLLSVGLFTSSYIGGRWIQYGFTNYVYKSVLLIWDAMTAPFFFAPKAWSAQANLDEGKKSFPVWSLLRGLVIALPIVLCFGSLLAAGDVVFKQKLDDFFDLDNLAENIFRGILILFYAYFIMGSLLHAALKSRDENLTGENKSAIKSFLGFTETAVILGSVSILFLAFVTVQFRYFFGGETNIGVEGFTYSQYARRGFNELVIVAFLSLVLVLGLSTITRRETEIQRKTYSWLSVVLVGFVLIILFSAYQRISLAIGWHGFSRLRLYPRIFLIWLGLLLITIVVLEIVQRERYFAFAAVLASVGFAITLVLFNVDAAIIRHNVYRAWHGRNLNIPHLASLSTDAIPALADEFLSSDLPPFTREGVGAILACYRYSELRPHMPEDDWRSFNLSKWQAHQALDKVRPYLAGYIIRYKNWPVRVRTPNGYVYECEDYGSAEEE